MTRADGNRGGEEGAKGGQILEHVANWGWLCIRTTDWTYGGRVNLCEAVRSHR